MLNHRIYSFLGILQKGGSVKSGSFQCENYIKNKKAHLVLIAEDASQSTKKHFTKLCKSNGINYCVFGEKHSLGKALGKKPRAVVVILKQEASLYLKKMLREWANNRG